MSDKFSSRDIESQLASSIFDVANAPETINALKAGIEAPVIEIQLSKLGGDANAALMISLSLDPKESWPNGIYQNSRYLQFSLERNGELECFAGKRSPNGTKFRKTHAKSISDVIVKINSYLRLYSINSDSSIKGIASNVNYKLKIYARMKIARLRTQLPFHFENGVAYIEDKLVGDPNFENYSGYIKIEEGHPTRQQGQRGGLEQEYIPESNSFEEIHGEDVGSRIIKYKEGMMEEHLTSDVDEAIKNGWAIEVFGQEKMAVIEHFIGKFYSILEEYFNEIHKDDDFVEPDRDNDFDY
jgi:hypothetical protein